MTKLTGLSDYSWFLLDTLRHLQASNKSPAETDSLKISWSKGVLNKLKVDLTVIGEACNEPSVLFVGNHISYLDIVLIMSEIEKISFVAKSEIKYWPLIGYGAKKIDTVFVRRAKAKSRQEAKLSIIKALQEAKRVALFPSGTTSVNSEDHWKLGAFDIAHKTNVLVQPFRIRYEPLRDVAYIDDDNFIKHFAQLFKKEKIKAVLEFHEPLRIKKPIEACEYCRKWASL